MLHDRPVKLETGVEARNTTVFGMTNLDNILKSRDSTLPTKVHLVKAMVFPIVCTDVKAGPEEG